MNLKQLYEYQNHINNYILNVSHLIRTNASKSKEIHELSKACKDLEDREEIKEKQTDIPCNKLIQFELELIDEKSKVCEEIQKLKSQVDFNIDTEINLNKSRREFIDTLKNINNLKSSESNNIGTSYKFNNNGEQAMFRYNVKTVTTIDFDRNKVKDLIKELTKKCDEISKQIDVVYVSYETEFTPRWDFSLGYESILAEI